MVTQPNHCWAGLKTPKHDRRLINNSNDNFVGRLREHLKKKKMMNLSLTLASPSTAVSFLSPKPSLRPLQFTPLRSTLQLSTGRDASASVVAMAKREKELEEIRALTTEQINEEVVDLKGELLMLRLQKSVRNEFKSSEFRRMRKRVLLSFS